MPNLSIDQEFLSMFPPIQTGAEQDSEDIQDQDFLAMFPQLDTVKQQSLTPKKFTLASDNPDIKSFLVESTKRSDKAGKTEDSDGVLGSFINIYNTAKESITGKKRATYSSELLPEYSPPASNDEFAETTMDNIKKLVAFDTADTPQEKIKIIRQIDPKASFEMDENGNILVDSFGSKSVLNRPGMSGTDIRKLGAEMIAFMPTSLVATLGKTMLKKLGIGVIGSAATQYGIEKIQESEGGDVSLTNVATAGAIGGASELIGPAIKGVINARVRARVGAETPEQVAEFAANILEAETAQTAITKFTGVEIPLYRGQKTLSPFDLKRQRFMAELGPGAVKAYRSIQTQDKKIGQAVDKMIDTIATPDVLEFGAEQFRKVATDVIKKQNNIRRDATAPLYKKAFDEGGYADITPIKTYIDELLNESPDVGATSRAMKKVKALIWGSETTTPTLGNYPTLKKLHKAKVEIDKMIDPLAEKSIDRITRGELTQIKKLLVKQLNEASPAYKKASEKFAEMSKAYDNVKDGVLGRVSNIKDPNLKSISSTIFDLGETNPSIIRKTKALIEDIEPEAWRNLLRIDLHKKTMGVSDTINKAVSDGTIDVGNLAGVLNRAIFGGSTQQHKRAVLYSALNSNEVKNFKYLHTMLTRAEKGRMGGSETAGRTDLMDRLRTVPGAIIKVITSPLRSIEGVGERLGVDRNIRNLTDILFDPHYTVDMDQLTQLDPNSEAAYNLFLQIFNDSSDKQDPE